MTPDVCDHPAARLYSWFATDGRAPGGVLLEVVCLHCRSVVGEYAHQGNRWIRWAEPVEAAP